MTNRIRHRVRVDSVRRVRRPSTVELMLLTTVLLWALNLSVTKYILTHGLGPLPYATVRYGLAALIFVALTLFAERTLRIQRRHLLVVALAGVALWLNQLSFVFALDLTTASTIGLLLGAIPIFTALLGLVLGTEKPSAALLDRPLPSRPWASGSSRSAPGGEVSASRVGILLGLSTGATWAAYSVDRRPVDEDVLALARQRDRHPDHLDAARAQRASADVAIRTGESVGRCGRSSSSPRSAPSC